MTLQSSGVITLANVNAELLRTVGSTLSLNDSDLRLLAQKPTTNSTISMSDLYGKTYVFTATISTNQQQINLSTLALAAGWNGVFPVIITINAGIYISSNDTSIAALTTGSFPQGLTIINNGFIMGKGGNGGYATAGVNVYAPTVGGPAISLGATTTINMAGTTSYIGGGGGGGGYMPNSGSEIWGGGGGGAGGGDGGQTYQARGGYPVGTPGTGGGIGSLGGDGTSINAGTAFGGGSGGGGGGYNSDGSSNTRDSAGSGGGGGRVFPGVGGAGGSNDGIGGTGGSAGNVGGDGTFTSGRTDWYGAGGGGGWGAAGGSSFNGATTSAGAAGGKAVALNGYTCTLTGATTRVYGAVS